VNEFVPGTPGVATAGTLTTPTPVVPDLIGLGLGEALAAAAWASTSLNVTRVVRVRGPWGTVVAQSPSPGTQLKQLWRIHVLVSEPPPAGEDGDV
jgi:beta-lactam-binding protein with PASTA domain